MTKFYIAHIECADGTQREADVAARSIRDAYAHAKSLLTPGEILRGVTELDTVQL